MLPGAPVICAAARALTFQTVLSIEREYVPAATVAVRSGRDSTVKPIDRPTMKCNNNNEDYMMIDNNNDE